jgi:hypothetical protein
VDPLDVERIRTAAAKALLSEVQALIISIGNAILTKKTVDLTYLAEVTRRCKMLEAAISEGK